MIAIVLILGALLFLQNFFKTSLEGFGQRNCNRLRVNPNKCTDNLDCPFPFRCCDGVCKQQVIVEQTRGDNLWVPLRMTKCPPRGYKSCWQDRSDVRFSGTFEDL